jgi:hypothetical protein
VCAWAAAFHQFAHSSPIRTGSFLFELYFIAFIYTQPQAGDYSYSGMHDDGPIPAPQEGGVMSQLIACVQKAKETNDEYLTGVIQEEKNMVTSGEQHKSKKSKTTA